MRIAWEKTITKMREAGFTEEEIEEFRKDPIATGAKFLDLGKNSLYMLNTEGWFLK